ncbi:MAG: hypothetical protein WKF40_07615 [Thermoleophilaceae bacterium]
MAEGPSILAAAWTTRSRASPQAERAALAPHFTNLDRPVFGLVNLPETVKGALFARYSRYQGTLRRLYLDEFAADSPGPARELRRRGGGTGAQALRAHLPGLRRRLGGPARRRAHRLRVRLQRHDQGAPARSAGLLPGAVHALHPLRRADGGVGRLSLLAPRFARAPSTRGPWTACSTPTRSTLPRVEAWAADRFPRGDEENEAAHARSIRAKALDLLRGLLPAASLSHMGIFASGQAYEQMILRLLASPLPEARDYGQMILAELKAIMPSFVARVDRPDRGGEWVSYLEQRASAADRWAGRLGLDRSRGGEVDDGPSVRLLDVQGSEDDLLAGLLFEAAARLGDRGPVGRTDPAARPAGPDAG